MENVMKNATESVRDFLGTYVEVEVYFTECYESLRKPNFSEFRRKYLDGTTAEGYSFASIEVNRSELTGYLRDRYTEWKRREI